MARITIEVDNNIIANALAFWFESDGALDAFVKSREYRVVDEIRAEGTHVPEIDYCSVDLQDRYGESDHTVTIELE